MQIKFLPLPLVRATAHTDLKASKIRKTVVCLNYIIVIIILLYVAHGHSFRQTILLASC